MNIHLSEQLYLNPSAISKNTGIWTIFCYQLTSGDFRLGVHWMGLVTTEF